MKIKKMMLVSLILLAVLTIGAVSASQNMTSDDLAVDDESPETMEVSLDEDGNLGEMNEDDVDIEVNGIDRNRPEDNFTTVSVTENDDGYFKICTDEDGPVEFYHKELSDFDGGDGEFYLGVSLNDIEAFLSENGHGNFFDEAAGKNLNFILHYQEDDLLVKTYSVDWYDDNVYFEEKVIDETNFECKIASHTFKDHDRNGVIEIWITDVGEGTIVVSISKPEDEPQNYEREIEEDYILVELNELYDIMDGTGKYHINVTYVNEDLVIPLVENHEFTLTQFNYDTLDDVYVDYPFDVIRFDRQRIDDDGGDDDENYYGSEEEYGDDDGEGDDDGLLGDESEDEEDEENEGEGDEPRYVTIRVLIDGDEIDPSGDNPSRWNLENLGIAGQPGDYLITIQAYDVDELIEEFSYNLHVSDDDSDLLFYSNGLGVLYDEIEDSVLYLIAPESYLNQDYYLYVRENDDGHNVDFTLDTNKMNWTLKDLEIDHNGEYEIKLFNSENNEIYSAWFTVRGIITEECFSWEVLSHESKEYDESSVVHVWIDDINVGTIVLNISNREGESQSLQKDVEYNEVRWELHELLDVFDDYGEYTINVAYQLEDLEIPLVEDHTFALTQLNYNTYENVYIDYPSDVIRFDKQRIGDGDDDEGDDEGEDEDYGECDDEDPLGDEGDDEEDEEAEEDERPRYATIEVLIGDRKVDPSGENPFRWTLNDLGISEAGDYEITIKTFDGEEPIDDFSYTLHVDDDDTEFRFYSNAMTVLDYEIENPVVFVICPEDMVDQEFALYVNDDCLGEYQFKRQMNWTLADLNIDRNGEYEIKIAFGEDGEEYAWLNVMAIISEDSFELDLSSHESIRNTGSSICIVRFDESVREGTLILTIKNSQGEFKSFEAEIDGDEVSWKLEDVNEILNDVGEYAINLTYVKGDDFTLPLVEEASFTATELGYSVIENADITYPFEVIRFDLGTEDGTQATIYANVYVNGNLREWGTYIDDERVYLWNLSDLGIDAVGEYEIVIEAYTVSHVVENFTYTLNVGGNPDVVRMYSNDLGIRTWAMNGPVVYVICPDDWIGEHFTLYINGDNYREYDFESLMSWTLEDLGIEEDGDYEIEIRDGDDRGIAGTNLYIDGIDDTKLRVDVVSDLYTDMDGRVIEVHFPIGTDGVMYVIVDGEVKYATAVKYREGEDNLAGYYWYQKQLNMTAEGDYDVELIFFDGENNETIADETVTVSKFANDRFRGRYIDYRSTFEIFIPEGSEGKVITVEIYNHDDDRYDRVAEFTYEITGENISKWNRFHYDDYDFDSNDAKVSISDFGDLELEECPIDEDDGSEYVRNWISITSGKIMSGDNVVDIGIPFSRSMVNGTITITAENYNFTKKISDFEYYEWENGGYYHYYVTFEDLDSFDYINDKDRVDFTFESEYGRQTMTYYVYNQHGAIFFSDRYVDPKGYESYLLNVLVDYDEEEGPQSFNVTEPDVNFVEAIISQYYNVTKAEINITSGDRVLFYESLVDFEDRYEFNYDMGWYQFVRTVLIDEIDFEGLGEEDRINFTLIYDGKVMSQKEYSYRVLENGLVQFGECEEEAIFAEVHWGEVGNPEFGQGQSTTELIYVDIPASFNVTEGVIKITRDDTGEVIYNKTLSEFENVTEEDGAYLYIIRSYEFDYDCIPDSVNLTFTFEYGNVTYLFAKGIRIGDRMYRHVLTHQVEEFFTVTLESRVLINGDDNVITIFATESANTQSVPIGIGYGFFAVYVNGKKVENLGRLIRVDGEQELIVRRLTNTFPRLFIYLEDINITENGVYDLRITYEVDNSGETYTTARAVTELYRNNVTLTSNVKVDNVTSEVYTGFGFDPILLYLDTYYGDINETSGTITVLNADNETIFTSDIKSLSAEKGRYYLKYSDFKNKDFGDKITVMYGDGNERSGSTVVDVTWKDVNATDFTPVVNDDVNDYYSDFISMNIPDLLDSGQIIVTIKYKNQHASPIANMNVTTDFDSQAVYVFNVADIKAAYGNDFSLAMSDLGFFESNGDYDIDVKFTAGEDRLNVTEKTVEVALWDEILINVNETTRYTIALPFAGVRVFEPVNAYANLYIDGELYSHKVFENGQITFTSSPSWTAGTHTANITVYDSEFGVVLNTTQVTFEVSTASDDVTVTVPENVKEDKDVILSITVPEAGIVTIRIDGNEPENHTLVSGANSVNLGKLAYGNRTLYVLYENAEGTSYYNNYINVFVGDDGRWLNFPDPIVLNDVDTVTMNFGLGATGVVSVFIDDKFIKNVTVENGLASFKIDESLFDENANEGLLGASSEKTKYGLHNYTLRYSGDGTHDPLTKSGTFTVAYIFKDDLKEDYPLMEDYEFTVTLPEDANGTVTLTNGNEVKSAPVVNGKATFNLENLGMGEHRITVKYSGDDRYPEAEYETVLKVGHYGVIGEYSDAKKFVSLLLPANATGNLTVFNDNMHQVLASIPLVSGKARFDLSGLPVGIYEVMAYYEGDDYDVKSFYLSFRVMPKVIISQGVIMGDDANIYLDLDNATGHVVIAMDGLQPVVQNITDGIVNYTFSTEGYFYGNHTVTFLYFGKSFDGYIFYEEDGRTPIGYDMLILARNTTGEITSNGQYVEACIYDDEGNIAYDANGTVTFFINGVKVAVVDIVDGIAKLDISQYKNGRYLVRWEYSGNNKYASSSGESNMDINGQAARIAAADASIAYSSAKKYSVTVYMADGKPAGNVDVSFLVNGKIYKTVKTDSKGVAAVLISQAPGSYKITAKASDVSVTKTLKVSHVLTLKKAKVKRSAKKLVIKATLKKVDGKFLKAKKITLKFNGKKFTAKTNKKGVAKFTIKAKVLKKLKAGKKVTYQATYLKDTVKKVVKVKK